MQRRLTKALVEDNWTFEKHVNEYPEKQRKKIRKGMLNVMTKPFDP